MTRSYQPSKFHLATTLSTKYTNEENNLRQQYNMTASSKGSIFSLLDTSKPQIRLIHIEPGPDNDEITCTLHLADFEDDSCRYEALSYEWGDASNTSFYVILNGKKFSVRENLWSALLYLRMKETVRIIWIDALCINQHNQEKETIR